MDQKFVEKAATELGENKSKKSHLLAHFRVWLSKHPFLKNVRQDNLHLIFFLRTSKFNIQRALKLFESHYVARQQFPRFFKWNDSVVDRVWTLFSLGYCYPLARRDEDGCRVVFVQSRKWNPEKFSAYDASRLLFLVAAVLLEEEETQIAGVAFLFDYSCLTLRHTMSPLDLKDIIYTIKVGCPLRLKKIILINLPRMLSVLADVANSVLSEKLRKKIILVRNDDSLGKHMDTSLLPKDFSDSSGTQTEAEMIEEFVKLREKHQASLEQALKPNIDWNKVTRESALSNNFDESAGSFRNLSID